MVKWAEILTGATRKAFRVHPLAWVCLAVLAWLSPAAADAPPAKGAQMPAMLLAAPSSTADAAYLGLAAAPFKLADIQGDLVLLEIIGVYCPRCREQAPLFNSLFGRLAKSGLHPRIKMIAIAAGATPMEVDLVRKDWRIRYPVVADEKFEIHKLLNEPKTPYTFLVDRQGRVLYAHEGVIKDLDGFYALIKEALP